MTTKRHHAIACGWGCLIPISYSCSKHPPNRITESGSLQIQVTFPLSGSVLVKHCSSERYAVNHSFIVSAADHTSLIISQSSSLTLDWSSFSPGNLEPLTPTWPDHDPPNPPSISTSLGRAPATHPGCVSCSCQWLLHIGCKQWLRSHIQNITNAKQTCITAVVQDQFYCCSNERFCRCCIHHLDLQMRSLFGQVGVAFSNEQTRSLRDPDKNTEHRILVVKKLLRDA